MSISKFQEKYLAKGCGTVILLGCAAVFGALAFSYFGKSAAFGGNDPSGRSSVPVAVVAGEPVPLSAVDDAVKRLTQQPGADPTATPPAMEAKQYADAVKAQLEHAAMKTVAKTANISFSDDEVRNGINFLIEQTVERQKQQFEQYGLLKPNATDQDFSDLLKKQSGKSLTETTSAMMASAGADLKDSSKKPELIDRFLEPIVLASLSSRLRPTDNEVKASFDEDTFKRIVLQNKPAPAPALDSRLAQVEKDLKSGSSFESVMDRYSDEQPGPKKKVSESQTPLPVSYLDTVPELAPLKSLKVGQVSDPIKIGGGVTLFKLIAVKNNAPADFQKNILKYQKQYQSTKTDATVAAEIKQIIASKTEWKSQGYKLLYSVSDVNSDPKKAQALFDQVRQVIAKGEPYELRPAQLAEYVAFDAVWNAPGADKVKLRAERIQVLNDYLQSMENFDVRMELVGLYQDDKNGPAAASSLLAAAKENNSFDQTGQSRFGDIAGRLIAIQSLLKPAEVQAIQDAQSQWKKDKAEADQAKALEEAERKKQAAQDAADQKAAAQAAKNPKVKVLPPTTGQPPVGGPPISGTQSLPGGVTPSSGANSSFVPPAGGGKK